MNAPIRSLTGISESDSKLLSFYRLRSAMLDCFADIEPAILSYVSQSAQKPICETAPLGQKIEAAKKIPAGPQRSKDLKARADSELDKIADLLRVRADLVHSRMEIAITTKNNTLAIFQNAKNCASHNSNAAIFTLAQLQKLVQSLQAASRSLEDALTARNAPSQHQVK